MWERILPPFKIGDSVTRKDHSRKGKIINIFLVDKRTWRTECAGWKLGWWACVLDSVGIFYAHFEELELDERERIR